MKRELTLISICLLLIMMIERVQTYKTPRYMKILIKEDGSIYSGDTPISEVPISNYNNLTYSFTGDFLGHIVVERSNCIIDGNGHELLLGGWDVGILLDNVTDVEIQDIRFEGTRIGIYNSSDIKIFRNTIKTSTTGIGRMGGDSSNIHIYGNSIEAGTFGISGMASNLNILNNSIRAPYGILLHASSNGVVSGNTIVSNKEDYPPTFGITYGIHLWGVKGYSWGDSFNNKISRNFIRGGHHGISLEYSRNNLITNNTIKDVFTGIKLSDSSYNDIIRNTVVSDRLCISLDDSSDNSIIGNTLENDIYNLFDIEHVGGSHGNIICGNYRPSQWTRIAIAVLILLAVLGIIIGVIVKKRFGLRKNQTTVALII